MAKSLLDVLAGMTVEDDGAEKTASEVMDYADAMADCDYRDLEKLAADLGLIDDDMEVVADEAEDEGETEEDEAEDEADEAEDEGETEEDEAEDEADEAEDEGEDEADEAEDDESVEAFELTAAEFEKVAYELIDAKMQAAGVGLEDYVLGILEDEHLAAEIVATSEKLAFVTDQSAYKVADDILNALYEKVATEDAE